ncbi:MAG: tRNA (N(6)-L-threonylcarbamoyladenosine(37)-C(2))-methylthiotransferase MtaB [Clostridia bacterium]|nr:tRNA (N(6)-L-threonylcarbamoyladenosine(37)-C(2))-methylthiotransferase MtaB [Clostridia bacterium]
MKARIYTLGCKVNQYESEAMMGMLADNGIRAAEKGEPADIVIVNSCTVTAQSDHKVRQTLHRAKKDNPDSVAVLTGCMVQAFPEESEALADADIILGNSGRNKLLPHIMNFMSTKQRIIDVPEHTKGEKFESMKVSSYSERTRAFVKIEDGCNRFCSYCIIPYARGRVRSKPLDELKEELHELAENGYKEVVLTGINLSCYGQEFGLHLCDAIEAACAEEKIERVRLGSLEPEQLSKDVIERMAKQPKLCPQFHLSLQSGCDETLKRMNRHYDTAEYREICNNLRATFDNVAITTDIMVGFAGETEEEFEQSLNFAKEISFAKVHVFAYSRRPGTKAYDAPNQVSNRDKEKRSHAMIEATVATQNAFYNAQIDKVETVLFEREKSAGIYEGYTMNYTPVLVHSDVPVSGQILPVKITGTENGCCTGELC